MGSSLLIALSMYSILPVPRVEWKEDNMRWSLACLPVVGLLGGGLLAGWAVLTWTFPVSPIFFGAVCRTAADHLVGRIPYGWVPRRDRRHFFQAGSGP